MIHGSPPGLRIVAFAPILLGTFFCVASAAAADDWPMFRGNEQLTGVSHDDLPSSLSVRWTFQAAEAVASTAAIVEGTVYLGCEEGIFYAIDLATGQEKWSFQAQDEVPLQASPLVLKGMVYFGDDDGILHALDASTGKERWTFETDGQIFSSANHYQGRILFGSYDAHLYCLEANDGRLIWKYETEGKIHGSPGVFRQQAIVAGCDEGLHVVNITDGKLVERIAMGSVTGTSPAVAESGVYVGTYGNQVLGIDLAARKVRWRFEDPDRQFPYMASAAITKDTVVIGGRDKCVRAFDPGTGQQLWSFRTKARVDSSPVVVGNRVFVGSSDGNLYELDISSGKEKWRFEAGAAIIASPAVARGCLVVGTLDGTVYCLSKKSPPEEAKK